MQILDKVFGVARSNVDILPIHSSSSLRTLHHYGAFCSVSVFSAGTSPTGVKLFGTRRLSLYCMCLSYKMTYIIKRFVLYCIVISVNITDRSFLLKFLGRYPQARRNCGLFSFLGRHMDVFVISCNLRVVNKYLCISINRIRPVIVRRFLHLFSIH